MRIWSLHPKYLDARGLVALWREALLAQSVLQGRTKGYRHHPQLDRFRAQADPLAAIGAYLRAVHAEASSRGYAFDAGKILSHSCCPPIPVTTGQLEHEWWHLLGKLASRDPDLHRQWRAIAHPEPHPVFRVQPGDVEAWERVRNT